MRLKYIATVDFRKNETTNFEEHAKKGRWKLKANEVVCFVSRLKTQVVFVHTPQGMGETSQGNERIVVRSQRLRISYGTWDPMMLANYANMAGIRLEGIRRFEEHYKSVLREQEKKTK